MKTLRALLACLPPATLLGALAFEHVGGLAPCELCLDQRIPYYAGIPLVSAALWRKDGVLPAMALAAAAVLYGWGASVGVYQAGAEWRWWEGPAACGSAAISAGIDARALLEAVQATVRVSCTEPAIRIAGLSLAGLNALASAGFSAGAAALSAATLARPIPNPSRNLSVKD